MSFWPSDTAGKIADACSVAVLIVTIILANGAWQVKRRFEKIILYPIHIRKLKEHISNMTVLIRNMNASLGKPKASNMPEMNGEIGAMRGDLNSLRKIADKQSRKLIDTAISALDNFAITKDQLHWDRLTEKATQLYTELENFSEGLRF